MTGHLLYAFAIMIFRKVSFFLKKNLFSVPEENLEMFQSSVRNEEEPGAKLINHFLLIFENILSRIFTHNFMSRFRFIFRGFLNKPHIFNELELNIFIHPTGIFYHLEKYVIVVVIIFFCLFVKVSNSF